jgi:hypothetical protein
LKSYLGNPIGNALSGSWREKVPAFDLSAAELEELKPFAIATGASGLIWRRVRSSALAQTAIAGEFRDRFRMQVLHHRAHELEIIEAFSCLRSAGIEPILAKGWAVARLYPERGLRPYGDIDLCVHPDQYGAALALIEGPEGLNVPLDIQSGFKRLDRTYDDLYARSQLISLGNMDVRVPGLEDHLRFLCVHMLRHGLWKPLWLCDVALIMESLPPDFDCGRCLSGRDVQSQWVICSLKMAGVLLGAKVPSNLESMAIDVPDWAIQAVLRQWGTTNHYMRENALRGFHHNLRELPRALRLRWPNPIQATVSMGASFNSYPRFPLQLAESSKRAFRFLGTLTRRNK